MEYRNAVIKHKGTGRILGVYGLLIEQDAFYPGHIEFKHQVLTCPIGNQQKDNYISAKEIKKRIFKCCALQGLRFNDFKIYRYIEANFLENSWERRFADELMEKERKARKLKNLNKFKIGNWKW